MPVSVCVGAVDMGECLLRVYLPVGYGLLHTPGHVYCRSGGQRRQAGGYVCPTLGEQICDTHTHTQPQALDLVGCQTVLVQGCYREAVRRRTDDIVCIAGCVLRATHRYQCACVPLHGLFPRQ